MSSRNVRKPILMKSHELGCLKKTRPRVKPANILTWKEKNLKGPNPRQKTTAYQGLLRVGDVVVPGKSTPTGYPIPNGQP